MTNVVKFRRGKFSINEFLSDFDPTGEKQAEAFQQMSKIFGGKDQIFMLAVTMDYIEYCHAYYKEIYPDEDEDSYVGQLQLFINELKEVK